MMLENKETTARISSAPTDERQLSTQKSDQSIADTPLKYKGENLERLATVDGEALLQADMPPLRFVVDELLPQGLYLLAGSPKVGKSWLSLLLCQTVATGGAIWGRKATHGTVLYLALEDSLPRLQARYGRYAEQGESKLHFAIRARTIKDGLVEQVEDFIARYPDTALVVIDTMQHVRGNATDKNLYANDYNDMGLLREITGRHDIAVLLVTHTRKMDDPDPLNRISGSTGLVGAVDGVYILEKEERTGNNGRLTIANRDTEGFVFKLEFEAENCLWRLLEEETAAPKADPLYSFLLAFMAERERWSGTATELCELSKEYQTGNEFSPATLGKKLRANQQLLCNKYKLWCTIQLKNNNKIITISKEGA